MKDIYTGQELIQYTAAIVAVEINRYYESYVKPLENEYDQLLDEFNELKKSEQRARQVATRLKNQSEGKYNKKVLDDDDATRYRNQCNEYLKTIYELREEIRKLKKYNVR